MGKQALGLCAYYLQGDVQIHYFKGKNPIMSLFLVGATVLCKERCTLWEPFHSLIRNVYMKNAYVCAFLFLIYINSLDGTSYSYIIIVISQSFLLYHR